MSITSTAHRCDDCLHSRVEIEGRLFLRCMGCNHLTLVRDERTNAALEPKIGPKVKLEPKAFRIPEQPEDESVPILRAMVIASVVGLILIVFAIVVVVGWQFYLASAR